MILKFSLRFCTFHHLSLKASLPATKQEKHMSWSYAARELTVLQHSRSLLNFQQQQKIAGTV
jgi:hypothetical protein